MGGPNASELTVPGLRSVRRSSLQQRVYDELAASLVHGVFTAGQVLRMQALADTLGVSVMPVREALGRLASERALEVMPNRSTRVPLITAARLDDLARARCLIEGELVRLALPHLGRDECALLRQQTDACEAAFAQPGEALPIETSKLNHAFHFTIYRAATSEVLLPVVSSLWMQSGPVVRASAIIFGKNPSATAVRHHRALIEAIEARDAEAAVAALHADITQSFNLIRAEMQAGSDE